uniref:Uncharacterized protein n=1 Tax=Pseudonaja textilis TaxID=8673 RepID=A0A670ZS61_PSETE
VGEEVLDSRREVCAGHLPAIRAFFKEAHLVLKASRVEDVNQEKLTCRLSLVAPPEQPPQEAAFPKKDLSGDPEEVVGTNYQKTNAVLEILHTKRSSFWAQAEVRGGRGHAGLAEGCSGWGGAILPSLPPFRRKRRRGARRRRGEPRRRGGTGSACAWRTSAGKQQSGSAGSKRRRGSSRSTGSSRPSGRQKSTGGKRPGGGSKQGPWLGRVLGAGPVRRPRRRRGQVWSSHLGGASSRREHSWAPPPPWETQAQVPHQDLLQARLGPSCLLGTEDRREREAGPSRATGPRMGARRDRLASAHSAEQRIPAWRRCTVLAPEGGPHLLTCLLTCRTGSLWCVHAGLGLPAISTIGRIKHTTSKEIKPLF